ncbi:extracellular solute-binding protein [Paenibacillus cymbidii]|uniref:extracellular solute-binding protein n=1 Tax=Paenibacillus cymbidii TaxID=1639034 RepID=UPI001080740B|nr:extracellular solute-binding protein [Paenibacillus cymbidii]
MSSLPYGKKWGTTALAAVCMTAVIVSGCSGGGKSGAQQSPATSGTSSATASATPGPKETVKLNFWGAVPEESGPAQVVENWNKANPDIQVTYKRFVNDTAGNTKLDTALLVNGEVDLFINYSMDSLFKRINAGMAEPLDAYFGKDQFNVADHFGDKAIVPVGGKKYYIPAIILNDFISINKSMLEASKLPLPTNWTWDDYKSYAQKMSKGEGANKIWGSVIGNAPNFSGWMANAVKTQLGANALYKEDGSTNIEHPAFKQYLDIQLELQNTLKVQPKHVEAKATKLDGNQTFLSGKAAMFWQGTANIRNIKNTKDYPHDFVTAFAPVPKLNASDKYETAGTGYLDFVTISSRSSHKEAAWKFAKWYVTEGNEPMIVAGRVPAWKKANIDNVVKLVLGDNPEKLFDVESFKRVLFTGKEFIVDTKFDNMTEMTKILEEEGEKTFIGEQNSAQAIQSMKKRIDALKK